MAIVETINITNAHTLDIIDKKGVQVLFFVIYTTIFVVGLFGNVLVCFVVFRNKAMQTVTNLFITNLALSDILLCVLAVPFTPLYTFLGKWVFGRVICHLVPYAQGASVYISTLTLMSIAIDRYFVIIYPFHPRMKLSTCIVIIVIIWIFAILVTSPYGIYMKHVQDQNNTSKYYCEESWPVEQWRAIFGGITTAFQFLIPFLIMAFCYICVSIKLNDRARAKPGTKNSRKEEADRERKRRTNRMLIAMVAVFLLSWLPLNVVNIINDFNKDMIQWDYYFLSFFLVHQMAMSSTCYNPFLYAWLNENFRKEFKQVLPCFDGSTRRAPSSSRFTNWRSERTCNGNNETQQESLLPSSIHRVPSVRERRLTPTPPPKTDSVEMENIVVPTVGVEYDTASEMVRLKLITEEDPPSYETAAKVTRE
ncbi:prolactin-releasing peptide receptor-like [Cylas formicarius]|uniref:prolactin-releasing peptide receptor-like n=1 Tax=Cylas formicarius TaxID=197179 RepID=UPI002958B155|nr:prolactin-releasing peptide receptor-like [Cylas formicarius]XP_060534679.1 prolactin-releasing peptide receptor-like [Cylas formicarius]